MHHPRLLSSARPRTRSSTVRAVALLTALGFAAVACGSDSSTKSSSNSSSASSPSSAGSGATGASGAPAVDTSGTGGTLIVGMTAGDIPPLDTIMSGAQGYEGDRFVGNQLYDGLTKFDLKQGTEVPQVIGDLATDWTADATAKVWTFNLRPGVTFHDGTPFNADAVVFNFDRYTNKTFQYFDATLSALAGLSLASVASYRKVSDLQFEITTSAPDAHLPSDMTTLYLASPTAVQKYGNDGFGAHPTGTGPFVFDSIVQGQQLTMLPNKSYWAGAPKLDKLILKPIPDATARIAALRSGQVNWIEYPTPDDIDSLEGGGFQILTNSYDHIWPWIFDTSKPPWNDVRVRQAANFAINREAMSTSLLHGTADPAYQLIPKANAAYSAADDYYKYDPAKAKELLKEAGLPDGFSATVSYPTSGSGNMIPGPMNEELQQELAAVGIKITLQPLEWASMLTEFQTGKMPGGASATNISLTFQSEAIMALLFTTGSPLNVSKYSNPDADKLLAQSASVVDPVARAKVYEQAAALITKDAPWLYVVNDRNPRALAPSVKGFVEPKSWFIDLTTVFVK